MKLIKELAYTVIIKENNYPKTEYSFLICADNIEEAIEIAKEEMKNHNKSFYIDSIKLCYTKAIKKSTKTITVDV